LTLGTGVNAKATILLHIFGFFGDISQILPEFSHQANAEVTTLRKFFVVLLLYVT